MKDTLKKLKDIILAQFSAEEQKQLNEFKAPVVVAKLAEVKTQDGAMTFSYEGDALAVGMPIMDITSGTPVPVIDGDYTLEDGTKIKVSGGMVSELETATPAGDTEMTKKVDEAVKTQMSSHVSKYEKLEASNIELSKQVVLLTKAFNTILDTPIAGKVEAEKQKSEKKYEDMSKHEQYLFNRGKL